MDHKYVLQHNDSVLSYLLPSSSEVRLHVSHMQVATCFMVVFNEVALNIIILNTCTDGPGIG